MHSLYRLRLGSAVINATWNQDQLSSIPEELRELVRLCNTESKPSLRSRNSASHDGPCRDFTGKLVKLDTKVTLSPMSNSVPMLQSIESSSKKALRPGVTLEVTRSGPPECDFSCGVKHLLSIKWIPSRWNLIYILSRNHGLGCDSFASQRQLPASMITLSSQGHVEIVKRFWVNAYSFVQTSLQLSGLPYHDPKPQMQLHPTLVQRITTDILWYRLYRLSWQQDI